MAAILQDLRHAFRSLLGTRGFTLVAVLTLAVGIGMTTSVFSVVEGVLLRSLPFNDADRLVDIKQAQAQYRRPGGGSTSPLSAYLRWQTAARAFDGMAAYMSRRPVLSGRGPAERVWSVAVTAGIFPLLAARPLAGRIFRSDEDRAGSAPVAVLSHAFWYSRMAADPTVVGRTLTLDTTAYTIVGVMPEGFQYPTQAEVWTNLGALLTGPAGAARARQWGFWVLGRLRTGVTAAAAQEQLDVVARSAWATDSSAKPWLPVVTPLRDYYTGGVRLPLWLMLGAACLVLLIACANVASLLFSRAVARQRQVAMRVALGAGRARLMQASFAEALIVALGGGVLGLMAAAWCVPLLVKLAGAELPSITRVALDGRVLAACLAVSGLAGVAAGALPAWYAARRQPADVLRAGADPVAGGGRAGLSSAVIAIQLALTMVLLAGAGLLMRSFLRLSHLDPGFAPGRVVVAQLQLPGLRYSGPERVGAYVDGVLRQVSSIPGVGSAAVANGVPLSGGGIITFGVRRPGRAAGQEQATWLMAVTPDYFRTLTIPLQRGRALATSDPDAIVIDDAAARAYFAGEDPVGQRLTFYGGRTRTVVGVVGNTRQESLHEAAPPHIYEALSSEPSWYLWVLVAVGGDPTRSVDAVRRALRGVDPEVPVDRVDPMTASVAESLARQRFYALLLGIFSGAALLLAAAGVYGLFSYAVSRRTREFGIRIALGADRERVARLVLGRASALAAAGILVGLAGALAAARTLRSLLFEVGTADPLALVGAGLLLGATSLAASWIPARRATKVDPLVALRSE